MFYSFLNADSPARKQANSHILFTVLYFNSGIDDFTNTIGVSWLIAQTVLCVLCSACCRTDTIKCRVMSRVFGVIEAFRREGHVSPRHKERLALQRPRASSPPAGAIIQFRRAAKKKGTPLSRHCVRLVPERPQIGHPIQTPSASAAFDFSFPIPRVRLNYFL